jgi:cbb3-type cytochrome c oxidase subunit I
VNGTVTTEQAPARGAWDTGTAAQVDTRLVHAHGLAALATLLVAVAFGIVVSLQLLVPDLGADVPWLSWGRLRYAHTQGIMLGWLGNAFLAFLYHAVPILTGRPVTSPRLGRWLFGLWNAAAVVPGWFLVLAGVSQPLEWAEFPPAVDVVIVVSLLLAAVQFLPPFFARGLEYLYVSSWYVIGALVFTLLAYPMGNLMPELVPGAQGAAFSGLWIHDAVGLFVTPLALAIVYFVIPASTGRPIYSHVLSMVGFWLLFFVYPLNGTHHYVFSVIPMEAQATAIAASTVLGIDVLIVVANLLLSLRGAGLVPREPGLRFVAASTVFYLLVSVQGSVQAQMAVNQAVHFSDWVIGHSHLAMLGFATFAAAGGLVHAWQRIPWARYNARAVDWAFWLLLVGVVMMVTSLTIAGIVEARQWQSDAPWLDSVGAARPLWVHRSISAVPIVAGFLALLAGLTTGPRGGGLEAAGLLAGAGRPPARAARTTMPAGQPS